MGYLTKTAAFRGLGHIVPGLGRGFRAIGGHLDEVPGVFSRKALKALPLATKSQLAAGILSDLSTPYLSSIAKGLKARFGHMPSTLKSLIERQMQTGSIGKQLNSLLAKKNLYTSPSKRALEAASNDALETYNRTAHLFGN